VLLQLVLTEGEDECLMSTSEVAGLDVKDDRDQCADVLYGSRLGVEVDDGRSFMKKDGIVCSDGCGGSAMESLFSPSGTAALRSRATRSRVVRAQALAASRSFRVEPCSS